MKRPERTVEELGQTQQQEQQDQQDIYVQEGHPNLRQTLVGPQSDLSQTLVGPQSDLSRTFVRP